MASKPVTFESGHDDLIHDAQFDYYGKRLATASSDKTIKIFDVSGDQQVLVATLKGHDGPVWSVAWANPKFGTLLASSSYDGKIFIWREDQPNQWVRVFENADHTASVNSVSWGPHQSLSLAAASADGSVSILTYKQESKQWAREVIHAHHGGVNAISWGPDVKVAALLAINQQVAGSNSVYVQRRIVTGGCDNKIKIWRENEQGKWEEQKIDATAGHSDWVRDVAWAPSVGLPASTIASCSEDKSVIIWTEDSKTGLFKPSEKLKFNTKLWRVSWSLMGNILAVSQGDNKVSLWKEGLDGHWKDLSQDEKKDDKKDEKSAQ